MSNTVRSDLTAKVWKIVVSVGGKIAADETVMILESMKMEIPVDSPIAGKVKSIEVKEGDAVKEGQILFVIE